MYQQATKHSFKVPVPKDHIFEHQLPGLILIKTPMFI